MYSKILIVSTSPKSRGGIATVVGAFSQTAVWREWGCYWVETHIDKSKAHKLFKFIKALFIYLCKLPFCDIVHIHVSTSMSACRKYFFYKLARLYKKKVIIHLHCGSQLSSIWDKKYADMLSNADLCLVLSQGIRDIVVNYTKRADNVRVLYNPCPDIKEKVTDEYREKIILFAATLYKEKGYLDLIDAFAKVCEKYPDWHLKIAGNGSQDEGLARVTKWGIQDNVEFLGWVKGEEKDRVFRSASIFCLPSYAEGFPMAVLDAWAYGIPVVTTPVGGIPDIVVNNENGLLFNPGDVETLSVQLIRLIDDDNLYQRLKKEAFNLASTTFNIETFANQISDMYNDLTR